MRNNLKKIYLIRSQEESYYKIGISNNPIKRLKELQTGNPTQLKIISAYPSEYANLIEKTLHRRYSHLKKEGEWFYMSNENEVSFINECAKIEEDIIFLKNNSTLL